MRLLLFIFTITLVNINQLTAQWDKIYKEKEGLRLVLKDGKYGYVNSSDKVAIQPQFDDAFDFKNGYAVVTNNRKTGFIDKTGKVVIKLMYDKAYGFDASGLAKVIINKKEGKIDKNGAIVIPIEYDKIYKYKQKMALVKKDNKYGYVNTKGKLIIPIIYDDAFDFDKNYQAKVKKDGKTGKISLSGNVTWNIQIGDIVNNGIVFYVDKSGRHGLICSKKNVGGDSRTYNLNKAEEVCDAYEGYNSWRLPSLEEAKIMLNNKDKINTIIAKNYSNAEFLFSSDIWTSTKGRPGRYYIISKVFPGGVDTEITAKSRARAVKEF